MCFSRNFNMLLSTLICFFVSVFSVLFFLIFSTPLEEQLSFEVYDIVLTVGENDYIKYDVNYANAEVFFSVADSSIAAIQDNKIVALKAGVTSIRGSATLGKQVSYCGATITVLDTPMENYKFDIIVKSGGYFSDNTIFLTGDIGFEVIMFDSKGELQNLDNLKFASSCTSLKQEIKFYYLKYGDEGNITFFHEQTNFSFTIYVKSLH